MANASFHILLTNDDGHFAPGIRAMRDVLKKRGYRVSMVAPSSEQSAASMGTTMGRNISLEQIDEDAWHLDARPADTVLVALRHLFADDCPDLILSGINFGPNLGVGLHASGTVAAALVGMLHGLPAIAISAGMLFEEAEQEPRTFPSTIEALQPAAEFTCSVIDSLRTQQETGQPLLPPGMLLNINYPPLPVDEIRGVLYPEISSGHMVELAYTRCETTGHVVPFFLPGVNPAEPHRQKGDVRAHLEGYITISPVKPSWNPSEQEAWEIRQRLGALLDKNGK